MQKITLVLLIFLFGFINSQAQKGCISKQITQPPMTKTYKEIGKEVLKYDFISREDIYYLDMKYFKSYINEIKENMNIPLQEYLFPNQIIYFDWEDKMVSFNSIPMIEFENDSILGTVFDWNSSGMYNTFPPTDIYNSFAGKKIDYSDKNSPFFVPKVELEKDSILSYIRPLYEKDYIDTYEPDYNNYEKNADIEYDYTIFILSNRLFLSYNPMAQLDAIKKNIAMSNGKHSIKIYLIMTDLSLTRSVQNKEKKVKALRTMCD